MLSSSVIIITYKRHNELLEAVRSIISEPDYDEIIIIDNDPFSELMGKLPWKDSIKYFLQDRNYGVAGGRNKGIEEAQGDILVFLDDDAVFSSSNVLKTSREYFENNINLACLAFRIENYYSRKIVPMEFPHPDTNKADQETFISYFLGGACALRRSALDHVGPFMDLQYGGEELELSFRLIKAGYFLLYTPRVLVLHKASSSGRFHSGRYIYLSVRNRMQILSAHLPLRYLSVNTVLWTLVWFVRAVKLKAIKDFLKGLQEGLKVTAANFRSGHRAPLSGDALNYLKQNGGRLWF
jgi:GT2 family glycosyltransferase